MNCREKKNRELALSRTRFDVIRGNVTRACDDARSRISEKDPKAMPEFFGH